MRYYISSTKKSAKEFNSSLARWK